MWLAALLLWLLLLIAVIYELWRGTRSCGLVVLLHVVSLGPLGLFIYQLIIWRDLRRRCRGVPVRAGEGRGR